MPVATDLISVGFVMSGCDSVQHRSGDADNNQCCGSHNYVMHGDDLKTKLMNSV
jgi:hypothetical protein|tara:strand:+ start:1008 stop:1169 length:162 start_codon:yes stop_codon:yes gene_type:complete